MASDATRRDAIEQVLRALVMLQHGAQEHAALWAECVAKAVKRATFPEYDGAPKTFVYPFLLSR